MDISKYSREIREYLVEIQENRGRNPRAVIDASNQIERYGIDKKDDALIGYAYFSRGETYYLLNDAQNFYNQMLKSLEPMERIGEWGYVAIANNMLGIMSLNRGNAPFALDYYIKAITICQDYYLPDLEWIVHMNIGSLYLNIEEYQKALDHIENSYHYTISNPNIDGYYESLTTAYVGMGKAFLKMENYEKALSVKEKIDDECMPNISEMDKLVVFCFYARLYDCLNDTKTRAHWIHEVNEKADTEMPVMDVFDDVYDYLGMLLDIEAYDDFFKVYDLMDELTKKTTIKNLEKKLLTLKIRYYRKTGQIDEYKIASVLFFEISEYMERENKMMVNNMIVIRNSYNELSEINKQVRRENSALQLISATDALTGLNNRMKLNEHNKKAFEKAQKEGKGYGIEILDIDYFKQYNDNYGHQAGDECIKFIAGKLKEFNERENIFTARYGGDEFVIIYENMTADETLDLATELKMAIVTAEFEHKYSLAAKIVTISQGICWDIPKENQTAEDFLKTADEMLYQVKKVSRNSVKLGNCTK